MLSEFFQVEEYLLDSFDSLIAVTLRSPPALSQDESTLLFRDDASIAAYNRWLGHIRDAAEKEEIVRSRMERHNREMALRLDSLRASLE